MAEVKERGILMRGAMAHAAHVGLKTQTLRVLKIGKVLPVFDKDYHREDVPGSGWKFPGIHETGSCCPELVTISDLLRGQYMASCPYGKIGDNLWIRETWQYADSSTLTTPAYIHRASDRSCASDPTWRPSLFMPREASRTTVEIKGLKVHRLQDITDVECLREGLSAYSKDGKTVKYGILDIDGHPGGCDVGWVWKDFKDTPREAYAFLWESINAKPKPVYDGKTLVSYASYPWEDVQEVREHRGKPWKVVGNPWVLAISFARLRGEQ